MSPPFHLAIPVDDLEAARAFYADTLGCPTGREDPRWIDFDFFGHQLTVHLSPEEARLGTDHNAVDGDAVPVRHFGVVLDPSAWRALADRLREREAPFTLQPRMRFMGRVGEQGTFFVRDPAGNALEFKCFADLGQLFRR